MGGGNISHRRRLMMMQRGGGIVVPANQIWYDADEQVTLYDDTNVVAHTFADGRGVITFDSNITRVEAWLRGTAIEYVYFPRGVTSIAGSAFRNCANLTITSLPDSITGIASYAFYSCRSIRSLTVPIITPPTLGNHAFGDTSVKIYVPAGSVDAYKTAWSEFADKIYPID